MSGNPIEGSGVAPERLSARARIGEIRQRAVVAEGARCISSIMSVLRGRAGEEQGKKKPRRKGARGNAGKSAHPNSLSLSAKQLVAIARSSWGHMRCAGVSDAMSGSAGFEASIGQTLASSPVPPWQLN